MYSKTRILLNTREDILKETENYYKDLYSAKSNQEVNLNNLLRNCTINKLSVKDIYDLEAKLTYEVMLNCLKFMSNNSCPGSSGITAAFFFQFFLD